MESAKNNSSIGAALRAARLERGISLDRAEAETNIRLRYLAAVEDGCWDKLPGEVFIRGIIRTYGNYLGLEGQELVRQYRQETAGEAPEAGIREVEKVQLKLQLKDKRDIGSGTGRLELPWRQIAAGTALLVVLCGGWLALPKVTALLQSGTQADVREQAAPVQQAAAETQARPVYDKLKLELHTGDKCWLEVTADGREIYAGMLQPGERRAFEAESIMVVKYGNVGVVQAHLNGEKLDMAGEQGVAVKTYTK